MTLTTQQIADYAQANNINLEYFSTKFDRWGHEKMEETWIGLELKKNVYYWWRRIAWTSKTAQEQENDHLFFVERYNQVNGASQKGWRRELDAEQIIKGTK